MYDPHVEAEIQLLPQQSSFSATACQTLSDSILSAFIARYAAFEGQRAVITCECATKLAARTLAAMATGQGYALGELVALADVPVLGTDVRIFRPLGAVADDEVRFFASPKLRNWLVKECNGPQKTRREGIGGLVEGFVRNLEVGFPSTVAVIGRTSGKLGMRSTVASEAKTGVHPETSAIVPCPLCGLYVPFLWLTRPR